MQHEDPQRDELASIKSFYDDTYYHDLPRAISTQGHYTRLARRLGVDARSAVLDVACGTGSWLATCAGLGSSIAGIDLSERAIDFCRRALAMGEFHQGPAERLPFESARFNLVTCLGSLEHFVDPVAALREMMRVARPEAAFVLLVPNADFLTRRLGLYRGTYQTQAKEHVRTIEEWESLFEKAGLKVESRWKDLHVLSAGWIVRKPWLLAPIRAMQAFALAIWPLRWQYQVYFLCRAGSRTSEG